MTEDLFSRDYKRGRGSVETLAWWTAIGGAALLVLVIVAGVALSIAQQNRCEAAGGKMVCHTQTLTGVDGKGRPVYMTSTDCRCLRADGSEVVLP